MLVLFLKARWQFRRNNFAILFARASPVANFALAASQSLVSREGTSWGEAKGELRRNGVLKLQPCVNSDSVVDHDVRFVLLRKLTMIFARHKRAFLWISCAYIKLVTNQVVF